MQMVATPFLALIVTFKKVLKSATLASPASRTPLRTKWQIRRCQIQQTRRIRPDLEIQVECSTLTRMCRTTSSASSQAIRAAVKVQICRSRVRAKAGRVPKSAIWPGGRALLTIMMRQGRPLNRYRMVRKASFSSSSREVQARTQLPARPPFDKTAPI